MKKYKKKSFFFRDYNESEFFSNLKNKNYIKVSLNRVTFLFFIFLSLILIFSIKIIYLSLTPSKQKFFFSENNNKNFIKKREDIVDRNGVILARNIEIYSAGIRPALVQNKEKLMINLSYLNINLMKN